MLIVNPIPHDRGWSPIQHMVTIAGELLDCPVLPVGNQLPTKTAEILSVLQRRSRNPASDESCLLICAGPADLLAALNINSWRKRFRHLAAWIIDSFWIDHIPRSVQLSKPFDHLFVTSLEDVDPWRRITGVPTTWLPWGSDVLRLGSDAADREWDIMRVGRQPPEWDDDTQTARAAEIHALRYRGRPASTGMDALQNQAMMMHAYAASKFVLAFSNSVNRDSNNHPTREYITGRWVDALSCGAIVAGIAPKGNNSKELLWPGATLELGGIRRTEGLAIIASEASKWTPEIAKANYRQALQKLDWRWRFKAIADVFDLRPKPLIVELGLLQEKIVSVAPAP